MTTTATSPPTSLGVDEGEVAVLLGLYARPRLVVEMGVLLRDLRETPTFPPPLSG